jgi:hypothetical protein
MSLKFIYNSNSFPKSASERTGLRTGYLCGANGPFTGVIRVNISTLNDRPIKTLSGERPRDVVSAKPSGSGRGGTGRRFARRIHVKAIVSRSEQEAEEGGA